MSTLWYHCGENVLVQEHCTCILPVGRAEMLLRCAISPWKARLTVDDLAPRRLTVRHERRLVFAQLAVVRQTRRVDLAVKVRLDHVTHELAQRLLEVLQTTTAQQIFAMKV